MSVFHRAFTAATKTTSRLKPEFFLNETNKKKLIAPSDNMNLHLLPITYTYYYYLFPVQYLCDRVHFPGILVVGGGVGGFVFVC